MRKITIVLLLMSVMFITCGDTQEQMPDGYKLLCSPDGKYCLWLPHENRKSVNVFGSKRGAISYAIHWEELRTRPAIESDGYEWSECF